MSKIYATTMLVILNNRIKISGGRFDQDDSEEESQTPLSPSRERRNSRTTKILVSNGRLTFQLADVPSMPRVDNRTTGTDQSSMLSIENAVCQYIPY